MHRHVNQPRRAVITGIGPVTPIGIGKRQLWEGLLREKSAVGRLTYFEPEPERACSAAEIHDFDPAAYMSSRRFKRLDRFAQFAVAAAKLAIDDSGLECSPEEPNERYGVTSQLQRAAVSVPSNIAAGTKHRTRQDYARFLNMAESSLAETEYLLILVRDLHYIDSEESGTLHEEVETIARMLYALRSKVEHL